MYRYMYSVRPFTVEHSYSNWYTASISTSHVVIEQSYTSRIRNLSTYFSTSRNIRKSYCSGE